MSTDPATTAPEPGTAAPDAPIPYTLTSQADAYLDGQHAEPEPEAAP